MGECHRRQHDGCAEAAACPASGETEIADATAPAPRSRLATALCLAGIGLLVAPLLVHLLIGVDTLRAPLARRLSAALGCEIRILGEVHLELALRPRLQATRVVVASPRAWPSPLAEIGTLDLDLDLARLIFGRVDVSEMRVAGARLYLETSAQGEHNWAGLAVPRAVRGDDGRVSVDVDAVRFKDAEVTYRDRRSGRGWTVMLSRGGVVGLAEFGGSGAFGGLGRSNRLGKLSKFDRSGRSGKSSKSKLIATKRPLRMQARGRVGGGTFDVVARLDPPATGKGSPGRRPLSLKGNVLGGRMAGVGTLDESATGLRLDAVVSAGVADIREAAKAAGWELAAHGPVAASARVIATPARIERVELAAELGDGALWSSALLVVGDAHRFRDVAGSLRLGGSDIATLGGLFGWDLDTIGPFHGSATFDDRDGGMALRTGALAGGGDGGIEIRVGQGAESPRGVPVELRAPDLAAIGRVLRRPLPSVGPVRASGRFVARDGTLGLDQVVITVGRKGRTFAELTGAVADVLRARGIGVGGEMIMADLGWLAPSLGGRAPRLGPVRSSIMLSDADGSLGIERLRIERLAGPLQIRITGSIGDVRHAAEIDLTAALHACDLAALGAAVGAKLPPRGPVDLSLRVAGSREALGTENLALRVGATRVRGSVRAAVKPSARPHVSASLRSAALDLEDLGIRAAGAAVARRRSGAVRARRTRPAPRSLEWLRVVDADLRLRADRLTGRGGFAAEDVSASASLNGGTLRLRHAKLLLEKGYAVAAGRLATAGARPSAWLGVTATGVDLEKVVAQVSDDPLLSGILAVNADLRSQASSLDGMLRALQGDVLLLVEDGSTASTYAHAFAGDLSRALLSKEPDAEAEPIHCLVGDLAIERGVATGRTLLLEVDDITILGQGSLDVARGVLDVTLRPRFSDPGRYSPPVEVTVSGSVSAPRYARVNHSSLGSTVRHMLDEAAWPLRSIFAERQARLPHDGPCAAALKRVRRVGS